MEMLSVVNKGLICWTYFSLVVQLNVVSMSYTSRGIQEICSSETFRSRCRPGELVVMGSAIYGRMRIGRCVRKDMGNLGCKTNVLDIADKACSGLASCEIRVPNTDMDVAVTCDIELSRYLETSHTCVKAISVDTDICVNAITIQVGPDINHIPSTISEASHCGRQTAPWILEASLGQTINLTLLDFSWTTTTTNNNQGRGGMQEDDSGQCLSVQYGYVLELNHKDKMVKVCGGGERDSHIYASQGNRIQIVLQEKALLNRRFLIQYRAVGCPDLAEPKHASSKRTEDELVVGCKATRQTWLLKCVGNRWVGVIGNCTHYLPNTHASTGVTKEDGLIHNAIAILVIIGVAAVISCTIIVVGIWCYKRFSKQRQENQRGYQCATLNANKSDLYIIKDELDDSKNYGYPDQIYPFGTNEYTHIWSQQTNSNLSPEKDDNRSEVPTHDAPLLPKPRGSGPLNNNVVVGGTPQDVTAPHQHQAISASATLEETVYKPSILEPTVNNLPPSKYLLLDRVK